MDCEMLKEKKDAGIAKPHTTDVLYACVAGAMGMVDMLANVRFRGIVWEYSEEYKNAMPRSKMNSLEGRVDDVTKLDAPGRFLDGGKEDGDCRLSGPGSYSPFGSQQWEEEEHRWQFSATWRTCPSCKRPLGYKQPQIHSFLSRRRSSV